MTLRPSSEERRRATEAFALWVAFLVAAVLLNGTVPFIMGADLRAWTRSTTKEIAFPLVIYGGLFLAAPLVLLKGWGTVRRPAFLAPLVVAVAAIALWQVARGVAVIALAILVYLHRRYDLSGYGIRTRGWKGDVAAVLLLGALGGFQILVRPGPGTFVPMKALLAGADRLFANPAASVENLFYFGFLAERLSHRVGLRLTPIVIGGMYTAHEMSNPSYWYSGTNFIVLFVGQALVTWVYLWRRGVPAVWLGDGLGRAISRIV